ncbi:MAG: dipeptidase, partial [Gammaproteobacteria bacterium]|nr:dipeptidase [Gammaproteobacteria bacterium]
MITRRFARVTGSREWITLLSCASLLSFSALSLGQDQISDEALQHAKKLLQETPLVDGHNDLPWLIREETGGDVAGFHLERRNDFDTDIP